MRRPAAVLLLIALCLLLGGTARADDDGFRFHRTTPRAALGPASGVLVMGVPGGRAWGAESELRRLPGPGAVLVVRLDVADDAVREAFVRIAYYASASARTRQLAVSDSASVEAGVRVLVAVPIEPPAGAVAYRVRVLARLVDPAGRSRSDAVRAGLRLVDGSRLAGSLLSRLLP